MKTVNKSRSTKRRVTGSAVYPDKQIGYTLCNQS